MDKYLVTIILCAMSGALSGLLIMTESLGFGLFGPGIVFGIVMIFVFRDMGIFDVWKLSVWWLSSFISGFSAFLLFMQSYTSIDNWVWGTPSGIEVSLAYFYSGTLGATLLVLALSALVKKFNLLQVAIIALSGGLLGLVMAFIGVLYGSFEVSTASTIAQLIIWQVGIGLLLVNYTTKKKEEIPVPAGNTI